MKKRLNKYFMTGSALVIVLTACASMVLFYHLYKQQVFDDLKAYSHILEQMNVDELSEELNYDPWNDELRITLVDREGNVQYDSMGDKSTMENHLERPEIQRAIENGSGTAVRKSATSNMHTFYYAVRLSDGEVLRIAKDSDSIYRLMFITALLIVVIAAVILILCGILSHYLTKKIIAPIEHVATNLDSVPAMESIYEELRPFIGMIREQHVNILKGAKMRQEFTANVSHELKTPLTAISGYAELISSGMTDEKDTEHFAGEIHQNADRLLTLINDIIKLSQLDDSEFKVEFEQVDLYEAARNCLDNMEVTAAKQDIELKLIGAHNTILANKNLIEELLYNLCSNAVRYNNKGGSVTVLVKQEDTRVLLSVKDTGIGIPKEHQERIFERFYRVDKSRSKSGGGTGLGLAIVKHIVAQHEAQMDLISEPGVGTEIRILF